MFNLFAASLEFRSGINQDQQTNKQINKRALPPTAMLRPRALYLPISQFARSPRRRKVAKAVSRTSERSSAKCPFSSLSSQLAINAIKAMQGHASHIRHTDNATHHRSTTSHRSTLHYITPPLNALMFPSLLVLNSFATSAFATEKSPRKLQLLLLLLLHSCGQTKSKLASLLQRAQETELEPCARASDDEYRQLRLRSQLCARAFYIAHSTAGGDHLLLWCSHHRKESAASSEDEDEDKRFLGRRWRRARKQVS